MTTATEADQELDQLADEEAERELGGPDAIYDDVWDFLSAVHDHHSYNGFRCDERVQDYLAELQDICMFEDDETYDQDEYVSHLEQLLTMLFRHFNLLLTVDVNSQLKQIKHDTDEAFSPWKEHMVRRMMLYVFSGINIKSMHVESKFTDVKDFESCLMAYRLLPAELRHRAKQFIEVYSTNLFETEHKGIKL